MSTSEMHVTRLGEGDPVVMVHGGAQGGAAGGEQQFAVQRPLSERGWQLVLPDRPGHGSSPSRGPEDLEQDAQWVAEMLGTGAHLVGHSYGGAIALCAAGLRPEAVDSLTLIEAPVFGVLPDDPEAQRFAEQIDEAAHISDPIQAMIQFTKVAGIPVGLLQPAPNPEQLRRMGEGFQQMRPPYTWDPSKAIAAVAEAEVPVFVVTGGWNPGMEGIGDALARELSARRLVIPAGHHFPHVAQVGSDPLPGGEFNDSLNAFLSGRPR